jgi:hypothetical protein
MRETVLSWRVMSMKVNTAMIVVRMTAAAGMDHRGKIFFGDRGDERGMMTPSGIFFEWAYQNLTPV